MAKIEKEIWVAREVTYELFAYNLEPVLQGNNYYPLEENYTLIELDTDLFPEVTFETGPKKYKVTIEEI